MLQVTYVPVRFKFKSNWVHMESCWNIGRWISMDASSNDPSHDPRPRWSQLIRTHHIWGLSLESFNTFVRWDSFFKLRRMLSNRSELKRNSTLTRQDAANVQNVSILAQGLITWRCLALSRPLTLKGVSASSRLMEEAVQSFAITRCAYMRNTGSLF
jgi:hypothetical protein